MLALLLYVVWRFHASRNPVPSTITHNTVLEIAWTIIPILILVVIAIPSFRLLYYGDKAQDAAMTVKVTGHQWYWQYEYPDQGNISVDSRILAEADRVKLKPNEPRLLAVDEEMVIPANTAIRIIGTARRFHARLDRVGLRHQEDGDPRPPQRGLDQGPQGRHLLRPVLADLRQRPRLHADRGARGLQGRIRQVGRGRRRRPPGSCPRPSLASATAPANR